MLKIIKNISLSTRGIIWINFAMLGFSLSNAFVKTVGDTVSAGEILFFRSLFFFIPFYAYFIYKNKGIKGANTIFKTDRFWLQTFRGIVGAVGLWLIFYGFSNLPLAEASALNFSTTLFLTVLSVPILKETVGWKRWMAVLIGFVGILLVIQPSTKQDIMHLSLIAAGLTVLGAFLDSVSLVYNRLLAKTDSYLSIFAYYSLWGLISSSIFFLMNPSFPSLKDALLLVGVSAGSSFGQYAVTRAFFYAEASLISPFIYLLMAWGVFFGYLFWGEIPSTNVILGASIVILVGVFVARVKQEKIPLS